ncbi:MAG: hypothetical protein HQL50_13050 [Magnetococcales bacterium]|nr:hypothetical protein [Magnetococcales bacterium]
MLNTAATAYQNNAAVFQTNQAISNALKSAKPAVGNLDTGDEKPQTISKPEASVHASQTAAQVSFSDQGRAKQAGFQTPAPPESITNAIKQKVEELFTIYPNGGNRPGTEGLEGVSVSAAQETVSVNLEA